MGDPPSLNSEFTTGFPASKYMYELVFALSETFTRPLHEALFTPTAGLQAGAHTSASEQSRLRPWPSAAIWRACGSTARLRRDGGRQPRGVYRGHASVWHAGLDGQPVWSSAFAARGERLAGRNTRQSSQRKYIGEKTCTGLYPAAGPEGCFELLKHHKHRL